MPRDPETVAKLRHPLAGCVVVSSISLDKTKTLLPHYIQVPKKNPTLKRLPCVVTLRDGSQELLRLDLDSEGSS